MGFEGAELRHRHLEIAEHFEQKCLELGVRFVDLVDQENGRPIRQNRAQERPWQNEAVGEEDVILRGDTLDRLAETDRTGEGLADFLLEDLRVEELFRVLPFVEGLRFVEALVALEPNQLTVERAGEDLGELALADAGRALDEDGFLQASGQKYDGRDRATADVVLRCETLDHLIHALEHAAPLLAPRRDQRRRSADASRAGKSKQFLHLAGRLAAPPGPV